MSLTTGICLTITNTGILLPVRLPTVPIDPTTDIVLLLDASRDVTAELYRREKEFVKSLIDLLNISPKGPHGIAVTYGENANTISNFLQKNIKENIDRAPLLQTPRRMDNALKHAFQILTFSRRRGPKVVIMLTTGRQTDHPDAQPLREAVQPLQDLGAATYVVAMGARPDTRQLISLVNGPRYIYQVPLSSNLAPYARHLANSSKSDIFFIVVNITVKTGHVFLLMFNKQIYQMKIWFNLLLEFAIQINSRYLKSCLKQIIFTFLEHSKCTLR